MPKILYIFVFYFSQDSILLFADFYFTFCIYINFNHIFAIEVKGGSRVSIDDFKHIKWFKDNLVAYQLAFCGKNRE